MSNFLVTGGAGFIGSHIVESLLKRGDKVRVLDNFATSKKEDFFKQFPPLRIRGGEEGLRTAHNAPQPPLILRGGDQLELIEASITDPKKIAPAFKGIDGVFHAAALARVEESIANPLESNEINITGTLNVILAARDAGARRIVFSSSSSLYGNPTALPTPEDTIPNPMSPYALQKCVGEGYMKLASLFWKVETISLRYFNVYGPRMPLEGAYKLVIPIFLEQKLKGRPLTITGDGTQTRDFVYVDDVVRANLLAMDGGNIGNGEIINIGTGTNYSMNQIAALIGGSTAYIPPRVEPHDTLADIRRAKKFIGWTPKVELEDGLKRTMEWYESMKNEL